jgi:hypothetical protein
MKIDKSLLLKDAHDRYRRRRGSQHELTFGECLRRAWQAAKQRQELVRTYHTPVKRSRIDRPFPTQIAA